LSPTSIRSAGSTKQKAAGVHIEKGRNMPLKTGARDAREEKLRGTPQREKGRKMPLKTDAREEKRRSTPQRSIGG
jgi:hypothetical protein